MGEGVFGDDMVTCLVRGFSASSRNNVTTAEAQKNMEQTAVREHTLSFPVIPDVKLSHYLFGILSHQRFPKFLTKMFPLKLL